MLNIFQIGDFYYFIFNPRLSIIDFVSNNITPVLGYKPHEFTTDIFLESIHPNDLPYFADFETAVVRFKKSLSREKLMKYKSQYNYRLRKKDGQYVSILQQSVTIQSDEDDSILRNLVIHTDISHIKCDNKMKLSFIGLEGEPSYIDVQPEAQFSKSAEVLTRREKEILYLISQHYTSAQIADALSISAQTVSTHRKNILHKTQAHSAMELVSIALEKGWI